MIRTTLSLSAALLLGACAAPGPMAGMTVTGSLGSIAAVTTSSTSGTTRTSLRVEGEDLLLERDDRRVVVRGAAPGGTIDFVHEEATATWYFPMPRGEQLTWNGAGIRIGERYWPVVAGEPLTVTP